MPTAMIELLRKASADLSAFLDGVLPRLSEDWWQSRVISNLSILQQRTIEERRIHSLLQLDIAALLRILDQNWFDLAEIFTWPREARNWVKELQSVRNKWAHASSADSPPAEIYRDADTLSRVLQLIGADAGTIEFVEAEKRRALLAMMPLPDAEKSAHVAALPAASRPAPPLFGQSLAASDAEVAYNWRKALFLHTGWADRYDGTELPAGGHVYLRNAVGLEAENFRPIDGWCFGYAPVGRTGEGRALTAIPKASRTLNIDKLGASPHANEIDGITIIWTARRPGRGQVIVGLYDNATVFRSMPGFSGDNRPFIAKARAADCRLLPVYARNFDVINRQKGFPGMAAAWFPGEHFNGPARDFLKAVATYLPIIRKMEPIALHMVPAEERP